MASLELDLNLQQELITALTALSEGDKSWIDSPAIVALVAGLIALFSSLLTHWFNLKSEKSRQKNATSLKKMDSDIRKQENIQEKQLEALNELSKITYEVKPTIWSSPDYDSDEADLEVFFSMGILLDKLDNFLKEYSYIMSQEVIVHVEEVIFQCNDKHWETSRVGAYEYEPTKTELDGAKKAIKSLELSINLFKLKLGVSIA